MSHRRGQTGDVGAFDAAYEHQKGPHPDVLLAELAAGQHCVVSHQQLATIGIRGSAVTRRVTNGRLHRRYRGVYVVGQPRVTAEGRLMAAVLASGPGAVVSQRAEATLLGLWDMRDPLIDITTDRRSGKARPGIRLHCVRCLPEADRGVVRGIPVTSVARMLLDLSEIVGRGRLARLVREADYQGLLDLDALDDVIARSHGHRRVALLTEVLAAHRPGTVVRSELEQRFLELCRNHGLPEPHDERPDLCGRQALRARLSLAGQRRGGRARRRARPRHGPRLRGRQGTRHRTRCRRVHSAAIHVAAADDRGAPRGGRASGGAAPGVGAYGGSNEWPRLPGRPSRSNQLTLAPSRSGGTATR